MVAQQPASGQEARAAAVHPQASVREARAAALPLASEPAALVLAPQLPASVMEVQAAAP